MTLKRKKNCKLIYVNNKYYIKTEKNLYHFNDNLIEAIEYYENISEIEKKGSLRFSKGKFKLELYPDELNDILKAIEFYKFSIDKSFYFKCDIESLKEKSFDLSFLYEYIFCIYREHLKEVEESGKTREIEQESTI